MKRALTQNVWIRLLFALIAAGVVLAALFGLTARGAAPPVGGQYPPVKQTYEAGQQQTRTAASSVSPPPGRRAPSFLLTPASTPIPVPKKAAGNGWIVEDFVPPFPAQSYVITSLWYEETGNTRTLVYAGALRDSPGAGASATRSVVIVVAETTAGAPLKGGGTYLAPERAGPLRIVAAQGERLVLSTEGGATLYFDVAARRYVSSP